MKYPVGTESRPKRPRFWGRVEGIGLSVPGLRVSYLKGIFGMQFRSGRLTQCRTVPRRPPADHAPRSSRLGAGRFPRPGRGPAIRLRVRFRRHRSSERLGCRRQSGSGRREGLGRSSSVPPIWRYGTPEPTLCPGDLRAARKLHAFWAERRFFHVQTQRMQVWGVDS
jgi:hypothetical protein